jgi:hypothetical protein
MFHGLSSVPLFPVDCFDGNDDEFKTLVTSSDNKIM